MARTKASGSGQKHVTKTIERRGVVDYPWANTKTVVYEWRCSCGDSDGTYESRADALEAAKGHREEVA